MILGISQNVLAIISDTQFAMSDLFDLSIATNISTSKHHLAHYYK